MTVDKKQGLEAIRNLMAQYQVTVGDIQNYLHHMPNSSSDSLIVRLFAYIGAVLVLGGISTFVSMNWEEMNSLVRVLVTFGSGLVAYLMALLLLFDGRFPKLVTPLLILAALLELGGLLVLLDEYFTPSGHWEHAAMLVHAFVGIQFGLSFAALKRDVLLLVTMYCAAMFAGSWFSYMGLGHGANTFMVGTALVVASFGLRLSQHFSIIPISYFFGGFLALFGLFEMVENSWMEVFYVLGNLAIVYLSIFAASRILLFVGLVSLFAYISYTAYEHFIDSFGMPLVLIGLGLLLFVLSAVGVKLNQRYLK